MTDTNPATTWNARILNHHVMKKSNTPRPTSAATLTQRFLLKAVHATFRNAPETRDSMISAGVDLLRTADRICLG